MNINASENPIRRILLAVDACTHGMGSLESAVSLAARLQAELVGLFVEDTNLLHLAGLPFSRELSASGSTARRMADIDMARMLRTQAARMQQLLQQLASQQHVNWSFRVTRGEVASEVAAAAQEVDLIAMEWMTQELGSARQLEVSTRAVIQTASRPVLFLPAKLPQHAPVICIYTDTAAARRAITLARDLAEVNGGMVLLLTSADTHQLVQWQQQFTKEFAGKKLRLLAVTPDAQAIGTAIRALGPGTVILPDDNTIRDLNALQVQLIRQQRAVLIVN